MTDLLNVSGLSVFYGAKAQAVENVSFAVPSGKVVALLGANGAGKTSIMKAIAGLIPARGAISFDGVDLAGTPARERVKRGIVYVPEGREIVREMTVRENLVLGGYHLGGRERKDRTAMVLDLFPEIANKADGAAWRLSGGEQQMLAIGRGLMAGPRLLLLDEPSLGLAPMLVRRVFDRLRAIRQETDLGIVLVEQNLVMSMRLCDDLYFLRGGMLVGHRSAEELKDSAARQEAIDVYLGAAA
ncbi:branched-chain amino acid transport system ATP-binding protein [Rhodobium orientis]|uniref:ABC transporter ATP-binding protein n=1 Tax=Rhodobium orientis TaxID=34017 RepID=A0A327JR64_9HYPH|nr:ABC transporter ATP-binding protein [Rhodobium orientis]MBB4303244.1 branched-chain amino acid transport system ATP-binding protein [Rhodobium orientis]MBK5951656.1 ABC transporter ATP-binding protein [Rhodobium orientis]RAI25868.1 ABC transporter ATP-binding protein [Rhodobium orientis]